MHKIRFGVIGMGNIGKFHADYLLNGKISRAGLTAVCSPSPDKLESFKQKGIKIFSDGVQLIQSGEVDVVIIATPHFQHTSLGIAAFENGVHVLMEKPISAHKADAEKLIAAHRKFPKTIFAGMFQMRTEPRYLKIRAMIKSGDLGEIVRVNWINTDWFRTEAYYASSGWRATWRGEGGGVLLNQCLHNLDALQWLVGMPARVRGFCRLGRYHDIEVEDDATAYLEWAGGSSRRNGAKADATGVFIGSTGEAPGTNRLEITGTRGNLILENNKLVFTRNAADMVQFSKSAQQGFVKPDATTQEIPFENAIQPHALMTQNFVNAILDGDPLIAPGAEGIHSLELANAMVFSSLLGQTIELPLDGVAWEKQLNRLIAESKTAKRVIKTAADDFTGSFKK
jgi:predicted dehydrogenase